MADSYYQQVVSVTEEFLGLAAERFVRREIEFHIKGKSPQEISAQDVVKLKNSTCVALGLLVNDKEIVDAAGRRFDEIINGKKQA